MPYCGYCHHPATFCCPNAECREEHSRAWTCKECGMNQKLICQYCGSKLIEEDELD
jgi:hypothetical protein